MPLASALVCRQELYKPELELVRRQMCHWQPTWWRGPC